MHDFCFVLFFVFFFRYTIVQMSLKFYSEFLETFQLINFFQAKQAEDRLSVT